MEEQRGALLSRGGSGRGQQAERSARAMKWDARGLALSVRSKKKTLAASGGAPAGDAADLRKKVTRARASIGGAAQPQLCSSPGDRPRYLGVFDR